jgi:predicted transposase YdaD
MDKVQERRIILTNDKEKLRAYQMRMMALSDWVSGINQARREGRRECEVELIKRQHARGYSVESIADIMSTPVERVQEIIQTS